MRRFTMVLALLIACALCACGAGTEPVRQENNRADMDAASRLLSLYTELRQTGFDRSTVSREEIIELAHGYISLHDREAIVRKPMDAGGTIYESVTLGELSRCTELLFGVSFGDSEMQDYIVARYSGDVVCSMYLNGEVFFLEGPAPRGDTHAVVVEMKPADNGSMLAEFRTFRQITGKDAAAAENIETGSGSAVLIPSAGDYGYFISKVSFDGTVDAGGNR